MKTLKKGLDVLSTKFDIVQWQATDPLPQFGPVVGVDTETELFTAMTPFPDMVVLGVYDPANSKCWIVYWYDALPFIQHLNRYGTVQYYFNAAYDVMVMNRLDEECTSYEALEGARLKCLMIRANLYDLATAGFILGKHRSLAACSQAFLGITLDKGDPNDPANSARMTFRRHNADGTRYEITDEQAVYLAYDCFTTYSLIAKIPKQPTEDAHTKGSIVLASITNNGLQVDKLIYNSLVKKLEADRDGYRQDLLNHGFPDPYKEDILTGDDVDNLLLASFRSFLEFCCDNVHIPTEAPNKTSIKAILAHMYNYDKDRENVLEMIETVAYLILFPATSLKKSEQSLYDTMCEELGILAFDQSRKKAAMKMLLHLLIDELTAKIKDGTVLETGFDMEAAMSKVSAIMDDNPAWWSKVEVIGPKKFQQQHLQGLLDRNPDLDLPVTGKSGELQLTLNDMWRLEDLGITDSFIDAYTKFNHCQKYLSTYLNPEFIQEDGRIHAKYTNVLRTGRTSCSSPNVQNLPSRDKEYPLKNIFVPYDGMILCATDYSFLELCSFAQVCYSRYGFSVMKDIINAGIDPHRWFAGVRDKVITTDLTHKDDPQWVAELNALLKEKVSAAARQAAKAANFGFPGALGIKTFYLNCRAQGMHITKDEAADLRRVWIDTFYEMKQFQNPEECSNTSRFNANYGAYDDEEEESEVDQEELRQLYRCVLPCGQVRNNCTYNAACNTAFQATAAVGAKQAGWNLVYNGYGPRLANFVHDEYIYCLYPDELRVHIPNIERLMIEGMKVYIPDVKVGVESTVMLHWDKKAIEFNEIEWDSAGNPIIEEPAYVQEVYKQLEIKK